MSILLSEQIFRFPKLCIAELVCQNFTLNFFEAQILLCLVLPRFHEIRYFLYRLRLLFRLDLVVDNFEYLANFRIGTMVVVAEALKQLRSFTFFLLINLLFKLDLPIVNYLQSDLHGIVEISVKLVVKIFQNFEQRQCIIKVASL